MGRHELTCYAVELAQEDNVNAGAIPRVIPLVKRAHLLGCRIRQLPRHLAQGFSDSGVSGVYRDGVGADGSEATVQIRASRRISAAADDDC